MAPAGCQACPAEPHPFASFLKSTLHLTRVEHRSSAHVLFPLPWPCSGVFGSCGPEWSSRRRHRALTGRLLHVIVVALNLFFANCKPFPVALRRLPNDAQSVVLANLGKLIRAFGSTRPVVLREGGRRHHQLVARWARWVSCPNCFWRLFVWLL